MTTRLGQIALAISGTQHGGVSRASARWPGRKVGVQAARHERVGICTSTIVHAVLNRTAAHVLGNMGANTAVSAFPFMQLPRELRDLASTSTLVYLVR
jgi:hypothetical protein